jgi:DNA-binding NarL/FixJ family response regulator
MKSIKVYFTAKKTKNLTAPGEVIIIMNFEDEEKTLKTIKNNASSYELKGNKAHTIFNNLINVHRTHLINRELNIDKNIPNEGNSFAKVHQKTKRIKRLLSIREAECIHLASKGLNARETAEILNISATTIRTHLEKAYKKLDVTNRVEAITECIRQGLIDV